MYQFIDVCTVMSPSSRALSAGIERTCSSGIALTASCRDAVISTSASRPPSVKTLMPL